MTPHEAAAALARPIGSIGARFMFDPSTYADAAQHGYQGLDFYVTGRAGVLGDAPADVVVAALGFFNPSMVETLWNQGVAVDSAMVAAERFSDACAAWGRAHFGPDLPAGELVELASVAIAAASPAGLPLFAGWRAMERAADDRGAACQAVNVLRELRGGVHLVAVVAAGIDPLHAVLSTGGEPNANLFGYTGPYPDVSDLTDAMRAVEDATGRLMEPALAALDDDGRARLVELVGMARAGLV